jgi:hypothetical protein
VGVDKTLSASTDDLRELNAAFKKARKAEPSMRYVDYLEVRKAATLEALAQNALAVSLAGALIRPLPSHFGQRGG